MSPFLRPMVLCVAGAVVLVTAPATARATAATAGAVTANLGDDLEESVRPRPGPVITGNGACPGADTIWSAMAILVPRGALDALPRSATVDVSDLGDTYRVRLIANGVERIRVYRDLARDCEQRARFAAVFIVLTLMPPELLIDSPSKLPPPEPAAWPPPPPPSSVVVVVDEAPLRPLRLELAAFGDTAPAVLSGPEVTSPGAELRISIGSGPLVGVAAVGFQRGGDFTLGALRAREQRVPFDVGLRLRHAAHWIEVGGEAGLAAALFRAEGLSPVVARQGVRLDLGVRAGATLRIGPRDARVAPIVGVHGAYFPRPYDLATTPAGVVGRTPSLRVGATVGLAASF